MLIVLGGASLAAWVYLAFFHGRFWRADQRLSDTAALDVGASPNAVPSVVAVVPAREEAEVIERSIASLLDQDYPGPFSVVLVDDHSDDDTAARARAVAAAHARGARLEVVRAADRPSGWVGKMWAVHSGVARALDGPSLPDFVLLTDADVAHDPGNVRRLVAKAVGAERADCSSTEPLQLVSLMVLLHCRSAWERLLIPAFVYFFQKLYPFP
ncbi:MAG: glycosyltransferase, partial [Candidatus Binatia bacterium]